MAKLFRTGVTDENMIKETLRKEGFFNIFTWRDAPHTRYGVQLIRIMKFAG